MTEYIEFEGTAYWTKVYKPDTYAGNTRWILDLVLDEDGVEKYKASGIKKKLHDHPEGGKFFRPDRETTKTIKGKLVNFTPPFIYDKDGELIVSYVNGEGRPIRSYDEPTEITRKGEPVMIGNGSKVAVRMATYPTSMSLGNRLESIKLIDVIEYKSDGDDARDSVW